MVAILGRPALVIGIALGAFACSCALWLGSALAQPPAALIELFHWPLRFLGLLVVIGILAVWALAVLIVGPPGHRAWAVLAALSLVSAIAWARIHTDLGVFALGGANYWLAKASASGNANERQHYLQLVLSATQYGPNIAEGAVAAYPPQEQAPLYDALASSTESPQWRQRYRELADRARQASGMPPNS
jgi:hypothetical protein